MGECFDHRDRSIHIERACLSQPGSACTRYWEKHQHTLNSLDGLEGEHLGEVVDQSFIGMTSWFNTRNQSKCMYKVHRHMDMKHVVIDIYKQNSSTLFFFFFSRWVTHCWARSKQVTATWKQKLSKAKIFQCWATYSFFPFFWGTKEVNLKNIPFLALKKSNLKILGLHLTF